MTQVLSVRPLLTGTHRYDKSLSTHGRGAGQQIQVPILAYLIETRQGRVLFDAGCDHSKIQDPLKRQQHYQAGLAEQLAFEVEVPQMSEEQRLSSHLARLGLGPKDIDLVFLSHLHFDHAGGLCELCGASVHVHADEVAYAQGNPDGAYFSDEVQPNASWQLVHGDYELLPGLRAINTPGHTPGHMSLHIELSQGAPILLAGDAADLQENLDDEVPPGVCWNDQFELARSSIRALKAEAAASGAWLWPNHDMAFWRSLKAFPEAYP
jgi:N-acyl homoserine lactone hydrolase